jgi:glyoxylase-like metal-dependent hydrolase (beta-lactamase superfamily II)
MIKKMMNPLLVATTAMLLSTASFAAGSSEAEAHEFDLTPGYVADGVYCFFGALDMPKASNAGFMSNHCFIQTEDSWLLWDTGATYKFAQQAYEAMQKVADLPVKVAIFSHEHDDHWLGANYYKERFGTKFIGTSLINERYKPGNEDRTRMFNILNPVDVEGTKIIRIDEPHHKKGGTYTFGGVKVEYISLGQGHSEDDYMLYLPEKKVILAGDVVMNGRITSNRNGLVMGQLKALDLIKSKDWEVCVPGHGFNTGKSALDQSVLYFTLLKERVLEAIDEGVDATEINEVVTLPEFKDKALYDVLNSNNVSRAYGELEMMDF